jgi:alkylresorcinol/alkylpyrone synthase
MTSIVSVQSAFPAHQQTQSDITKMVTQLNGLDGVQRALVERLHANAGVKTRRTAMSVTEYGGLSGLSATNDRYIREATDLGERALRSALDTAGLAAHDLDLLIVTSVTGVAVPSLDARLIPRLGLRPDIKRLPIFGLGCVAGAAGLGRLHDYLLAWPHHHAALLAVELCSLTWPRTGVTTADLVASGLFGDGAVAVVARGEPTVGAPEVIDSRSEVYPDCGDALGWRLGSDGFRIVLTAELADVVERRISRSVVTFLAEHGLTVEEISTWVCHPGGPKVIDAVQRSLKLPDSAMELSRRSLAEVGNMSSASVLHILQQAIGAGPAPKNSAGLIIGLGPGVSVELVLFRW